MVEGKPLHVGGWGYEISDEGSGAALGRDLLRRAIWAHDGRIPRSSLADAVWEEFGDTPERLVDWVGLRVRATTRASPLSFWSMRGCGIPSELPSCRRPPRESAPSRPAFSTSALRPCACSAAWASRFSPGSRLPCATRSCLRPPTRWTAPSSWPAVTPREHDPMIDQAAELLHLRTLDEADPTPLYLQLQHFIEEAVRSGSLNGTDGALPGERDLARQLGISRVTVRKAIMGLVKKGVLVQRWGSGTFVAHQMRLEQPLSRLSSFTDDMSARGLQSWPCCSAARAVQPPRPS